MAEPLNAEELDFCRTIAPTTLIPTNGDWTPYEVIQRLLATIDARDAEIRYLRA